MSQPADFCDGEALRAIKTAKGEPKGENEAAMEFTPAKAGQTFSFPGDGDASARRLVVCRGGEKKAGCVGGLLELLA